MVFPSVEYFQENLSYHAQKMLLKTIIICACITTTTLSTSVEVNHSAHGLEQVCQKGRRACCIQIPTTIHVAAVQPCAPMYRSCYYLKNATGLCVKLTAELQVYLTPPGPCLGLPGSLFFQFVQLLQQLPNEKMTMNQLCAILWYNASCYLKCLIIGNNIIKLFYME